MHREFLRRAVSGLLLDAPRPLGLMVGVAQCASGFARHMAALWDRLQEGIEMASKAVQVRLSVCAVVVGMAAGGGGQRNAGPHAVPRLHEQHVRQGPFAVNCQVVAERRAPRRAALSPAPRPGRGPTPSAKPPCLHAPCPTQPPPAWAPYLVYCVTHTTLSTRLHPYLACHPTGERARAGARGVR